MEFGVDSVTLDSNCKFNYKILKLFSDAEVLKTDTPVKIQNRRSAQLQYFILLTRIREIIISTVRGSKDSEFKPLKLKKIVVIRSHQILT